MFGIGPTELIVILVVGLLILGPKRLPELARTLGKGFAEFRRATNDLRSQIETSVDEPPSPPTPPAAPPPPEKPSKLPPEHPSARSPEDQLNAEGDIPLAAPASAVEDTPPKKIVTTIWDESEPSTEEAAPSSEDEGSEDPTEASPSDEDDGVRS